MVDRELANAALDLASGYSQGAAKDRIVQAFFAGAVAANPDSVTTSEIMAVAMSGATVVERWAGREPPQAEPGTQGGQDRWHGQSGQRGGGH
jgi:hypothetical protein